MVDGDRGKVLPQVIQLSLGVDRSIFALMDHFFIHEKDLETYLGSLQTFLLTLP